MIRNFIPNMYQKNIYKINYGKLKKIGIKCLLFDLDNTLSPPKESKFYEETKELFNKLKKDFIIIVFSNNFKKRVLKFGDFYNVDHVYFTLKPFRIKYRLIMKKYKLKPNEIATIGDQLLTDILGGNKMNFFTILVSPMVNEDEKETFINRQIEKVIFKKFENKGILKRGNYYD